MAVKQQQQHWLTVLAAGMCGCLMLGYSKYWGCL